MVIDRQSGVNLDNLGEILGVLRDGLDDERYRVFLKVGIQRLISRGDIFSINEIGKALGISPLRITENGDVLRLDGSWILDGSELLEYEEKPARFSFNRNQSVYDDVADVLEITTIIESVRAAGILADIYFNFDILSTQMLDYTQTFSGVLDGSWLLDGQLALCGCDDKVFTPNFIALGDGAEPGGNLRPPEPGDTGLQNEIVRKDVLSFNDENGIRTHQITLTATELDGFTINEIAIFRDSEPILIGAFPGKDKDAVTRFTFNIKEVQ
jgi:hypothetical protein